MSVRIYDYRGGRPFSYILGGPDDPNGCQLPEKIPQPRSPMQKNIETRQRAVGQDFVVYEVAWETSGASPYRAFLYADGVMVFEGPDLRTAREKAAKLNDAVYIALDSKATDDVGFGYGSVTRVALEWK